MMLGHLHPAMNLRTSDGSSVLFDPEDDDRRTYDAGQVRRFADIISSTNESNIGLGFQRVHQYVVELIPLVLFQKCAAYQ